MLSLLWGPWGAQGEPRGHFLVGFGAMLARFFDVFCCFLGCFFTRLAKQTQEEKQEKAYRNAG